MLVAELLCDKPDLSTMLDVDQSVLTDDPAIPKGIRGQEMPGRQERSIVADDTKAVGDGIAGNPQARSIVVCCALDRHQTTGIPDFFGFVFESERGEEHDF